MGKRQPLPRNAFSNPPFSMLPFFGKYFLRQIIHAQSNIERGKGRGKVGNNKRRNHMRNKAAELVFCFTLSYHSTLLITTPSLVNNCIVHSVVSTVLSAIESMVFYTRLELGMFLRRTWLVFHHYREDHQRKPFNAYNIGLNKVTYYYAAPKQGMKRVLNFGQAQNMVGKVSNFDHK